MINRSSLQLFFVFSLPLLLNNLNCDIQCFTFVTTVAFSHSHIFDAVLYGTNTFSGLELRRTSRKICDCNDLIPTKQL